MKKGYKTAICCMLVLGFFSVWAGGAGADNIDDENASGGGLFRPAGVSPDPGRAALKSAILPGLGQAYNGKYFKIPVIYALGGGLIWGFSYQNERFIERRDAYRYRQDGGEDIFHPEVTNDRRTYTDQQLISAREFYRRNRDLFAIGMAALYILNVVDAYVDAHLYEFDVSDDLSLHFDWNRSMVHNTPESRFSVILSF